SDQDAWAELDPKADVVVWFNDLSLCTAPAERKRYCIPTAYGLPELITLLHLEPVVEFAEGGIYRVSEP
ncbi:MAG: hypothetical protein HY866_01680, partial [Chloroflexi bacterium]|nr:hypothetical protein [Chloroflexota bacterium]